MKKGDLLFVYGTLMRGEGASLRLNAGVQYVGEDMINGEIYDLGSYPGVKAPTGYFVQYDPVVHGEVYRLLDDKIVHQLDAYEGYPSLYNRIETWTADGRAVWVYTYNGRVSDERLIRSGSWRERKAA